MSIQILYLLSISILFIHNIHTMDIQESINNQQENTGQVSTLRQRRNTNNAITQRLPSSAEISSLCD